jgi:hypothetical protein
MALVGVLAVIGCAGSGSKAQTGGTTGSAGGFAAGGTTATGGGTPTGGVVGSSGAGGGDARPADGASGGSGGAGGTMTADEACRAVLGVLCDRFAACTGNAAADPATLSPPCDDVPAACPDYLFNEASTRTVAAITGCLADLGGLSCTDLDLTLRPSCWTPGTRPAGAACARASNCQSGGCSGIDRACGTCVGNLVATGESCADSSAVCRRTDFCHPATKLCTPGSTIVHAGKGEACDPAAVPAVGCAGDLHCLVPDGGTVGTCGTREPPIVVGEGEACDTLHTCGPGLTCFTTITFTDDGGYTSSPSTCVLSTNCGTKSCDDTTFCRWGDGGPSCVPLAAAGERCLGDGGRVTTPCLYDLNCSGTTGVCTAFGKQGDACDDRNPCAQHLLCVGGHCLPLSTQTCSMTSPDSGAP